MGNLYHLCKRIKNYLLDMLFPVWCLGCNKPKTLLCDSCLNNIPKAPFLNEEIKSIFHYKDKIMRKSIWMLKYHHGRIIAKSFGRVLADEIISEYEDLCALYPNKKVYIIPIPISDEKLKVRGYNQTEILIKECIPYLDKDLFIFNKELLKKKNAKESQARVGKKKKRQENIKDSMYLAGEIPKGSDIILIDDVVTTGATINEAKRALKELRPKNIRAVTLAH